MIGISGHQFSIIRLIEDDSSRGNIVIHLIDSFQERLLISDIIQPYDLMQQLILRLSPHTRAQDTTTGK